MTSLHRARKRSLTHPLGGHRGRSPAAAVDCMSFVGASSGDDEESRKWEEVAATRV
jgi:hypothetical protein